MSTATIIGLVLAGAFVLVLLFILVALIWPSSGNAWDDDIARTPYSSGSTSTDFSHRTGTSATSSASTLRSLRGGLNELYCSQTCYERGGTEVAHALTRQWKCPSCGAALSKGSLIEDMASRGATITGTATCTNCGSRFSQADVYRGRYDVSDVSAKRRVCGFCETPVGRGPEALEQGVAVFPYRHKWFFVCPRCRTSKAPDFIATISECCMCGRQLDSTS